MKKLSVLCFSLLLTVLLLPCSVMAADTVDSGSCGDDLTWTLDSDGLLTISGTGAMKDCSSYNKTPWYSHRTDIVSIDISDDVTGICEGAFSGCSALESITVPFVGDSKKTASDTYQYPFGYIFGTYSYTGGTATTQWYYGSAYHIYYIPSSLKSATVTGGNIVYGAFDNCSGLTSITIGDGVTSIGERAFYGCSGLISIDIPDSVTSIGDKAFYDCSGLTSVTVDEDNTVYDSRSNCNAIIETATSTLIFGSASTVIPNSVTSIGSSAFFGCSGLTSIDIPDSVTSIYSSAFSGCSGLKSIDVPGSVTSIGDNVFYGCSGLTSIDIPDSVTSIGEWAFSGCSGLTRIDIGDGVTSIGSYAFYGCSALTSIIIGNGVTSIGNQTFSGCSGLISINIPDSVTSIGSEAFYGCSSLNTTVYDNVHYLGNSDHPYLVLWEATSTGITSVSIPDETKFILSYAFCDCSSLAIIDIPDSVTSIGEGAFSGCSSLNTTVYNNAHYLGNSDHPYLVLWEATSTGITSVSIPEETKFILERAFFDCSDLSSIDIPDSVTSIGEYAFYSCSKLSSIDIPDDVTYIGSDAFLCCNSLTDITIGSGVTSIDDFAFSNCGSLQGAEFLGDAPQLGGNVFSGAASGFTVFYHEGTEGWTSPTWNSYPSVCAEAAYTTQELDGDNRNGQGILFTLNEEAKTAIVGSNTSEANNSGYRGIGNFSVVIPDTVSKDGVEYKVISIGENAFSGCAFLDALELGNNLTSISASAFRDCASFAAFTVREGNAQYNAVNGILYDAGGYALYIYPAGKTETAFTVPDTVRTIGADAFRGAEALETVTVPATVKSIGSNAFYGCNSLEEITLPFIGRNAAAGDSFSYVFGSVPQSLKKVTVLGGKLPDSAFKNCSSMEDITLPSAEALGATGIPSYCFCGCTALKNLRFGTSEGEGLLLPDTLTSIGNSAFFGCEKLTQIAIPAAVTSIGSNAFKGCRSVKSFSVPESNTAFTADRWGVLYSKNMSRLLYYPTARSWPYYNVSDLTTTIGSGAFYQTSQLVNLYIPNTVTTLSSSCISSCSGLTVCVYMNSDADSYCTSNDLTAWYMDNYAVQGIAIYSLPTQTVFEEGKVDLSGLYMTARVLSDNGVNTIQLDDYELMYDADKVGTQTVAVKYGSMEQSFDITVYKTGFTPVGFSGVAEADIYYVAIFNAEHRLIGIYTPTVSGSTATVFIDPATYGSMASAKLFSLGSGFAPCSVSLVVSK